MNAADWGRSWEKHLAQYLSAPPRSAYFIKSRIPDFSSTLEIGCGSSRDSLFFSQVGVNAYAMDYNYFILDRIKNKSAAMNTNVRYLQADGFSLPFRDKSFDLVFHNGFFVLFHDDNDIVKLLREQCRVARKWIVFFVHNSLNKKLVKKFSNLALSDSLYNIRFFSPNEIEAIVKKTDTDFASFNIEKFGGYFDVLYASKIKKILPNLLFPLRKSIVPFLYQAQNWKNTERIICLIKL